MRKSIALAFVVAGATCTACSLIVGDLSYLTSTSDDASAAGDSSNPDASMDGAAADSSITDAFTSDGRFCNSQNPAPEFCADFDDEAGLSAFNTYVGSTGVLDLTADAFSAPFAVQSTVKKDNSAGFVADAGTPSGTVTFSARFRVDAEPTHANTDLFDLFDAQNEYDFFLVLGGGDVAQWFATYDQGALVVNEQLGGSIAISPHEWHAIRVVVNLTTNPVSVTTTLDGNIFCADTVPQFTPTSSCADIGISYEADTTTTTVSYDNIVLYTH